MNIVLIGPQGSGKGTQAKLLVKQYRWNYFESGSILRKKSREKSSLGRAINKTIHQQGKLVSDEVAGKVVRDWLAAVGFKKGIIFDGFPRNLTQYRLLEKVLEDRKSRIDKVVYLSVSRSVSQRRLSSRRICPKCGVEYNLITKKPEEDQKCDYCRQKLIRRLDDTPSKIATRLNIFYKTTWPIIDYVRRQGILLEIDGERPVEVIYRDILKGLQR